MTLNFTAKSWYRRLNRVLNTLAILLLIIHSGYALSVSAVEQQWQKRIVVIDNSLQYVLLNPLIGDALGFSLPLFNIGYVSKPAVLKANTDLSGVIAHEAKHLQQMDDLGLFSFLTMASWKLEGLADYARGKSTLDLCQPKADATDGQRRYREYHLVVKYLIEQQKLNEAQIYQLNEYPVDAAEKWMKESYCVYSK